MSIYSTDTTGYGHVSSAADLSSVYSNNYIDPSGAAGGPGRGPVGAAGGPYIHGAVGPQPVDQYASVRFSQQLLHTAVDLPVRVSADGLVAAVVHGGGNGAGGAGGAVMLHGVVRRGAGRGAASLAEDDRPRPESDLTVEDVTSEDESAVSLVAETRYLPVPTEPSTSPSPQTTLNRPITAPPAYSQPSIEQQLYSNDNMRPVTAQGGSSATQVTGGEQPDAAGGRRIAAKFGPNLQPKPSDQKPLPSRAMSPKRCSSPLVKGREFDGDHGISLASTMDEDDSSAATSDSAYTLERKLLKCLLKNHKNKRDAASSSSEVKSEATVYSPAKYVTPTRKQKEKEKRAAAAAEAASTASDGKHKSASTQGSDSSSLGATAGTGSSASSHSDGSRANDTLPGSASAAVPPNPTPPTLSNQAGDRVQASYSADNGSPRNKPALPPKPVHHRNVHASIEEDHKEKCLAATKLQAWWKGFHARLHDPVIIWVQNELRAKRSQEHIRLLKQEVQRNKELYHQERTRGESQRKAIEDLRKEVTSLKEWQRSIDLAASSQVTQSFVSADASIQTTDSNASVIQTDRLSSLPPFQSFPQNAAVSHPGPALSAASPKTSLQFRPTGAAAAYTAQHTQQHVSYAYGAHTQHARVQAQQISYPDNPFNGSRAVHGMIPPTHPVQPVLYQHHQPPLQPQQLPQRSVKEAQLESLCISLQEQIKNLSEAFYDLKNSRSIQIAKNQQECSQSTGEGAKDPCEGGGYIHPLPPENLTATAYQDNAALLQWEKSVSVMSPDNAVMGYRVYVDGVACVLTKPDVTHWVLAELVKDHTYCVNVSTMCTLNESVHSNTVYICLRDEALGIDVSYRPPDADDHDNHGNSNGTDDNEDSDNAADRHPDATADGKDKVSSSQADGSSGPIKEALARIKLDEYQDNIQVDSGYLTSPNNPQKKHRKHKQKPTKDKVENAEFDIGKSLALDVCVNYEAMSSPKILQQLVPEKHDMKKVKKHKASPELKSLRSKVKVSRDDVSEKLNTAARRLNLQDDASRGSKGNLLNEKCKKLNRERHRMSSSGSGSDLDETQRKPPKYQGVKSRPRHLPGTKDPSTAQRPAEADDGNIVRSARVHRRRHASSESDSATESLSSNRPSRHGVAPSSDSEDELNKQCIFDLSSGSDMPELVVNQDECEVVHAGVQRRSASADAVQDMAATDADQKSTRNIPNQYYSLPSSPLLQKPPIIPPSQTSGTADKGNRRKRTKSEQSQTTQDDENSAIIDAANMQKKTLARSASDVTAKLSPTCGTQSVGGGGAVCCSPTPSQNGSPPLSRKNSFNKSSESKPGDAVRNHIDLKVLHAAKGKESREVKVEESQQDDSKIKMMERFASSASPVPFPPSYSQRVVSMSRAMNDVSRNVNRLSSTS